MKQQKTKSRFVICVRNEGCEDLVLRKVCQVMPDIAAARENHVRILDESGEDYLYPADFFMPVVLPRAVEHAVCASAA